MPDRARSPILPHLRVVLGALTLLVSGFCVADPTYLQVVARVVPHARVQVLPSTPAREFPSTGSRIRTVSLPHALSMRIETSQRHMGITFKVSNPDVARVDILGLDRPLSFGVEGAAVSVPVPTGRRDVILGYQVTYRQGAFADERVSPVQAIFDL